MKKLTSSLDLNSKFSNKSGHIIAIDGFTFYESGMNCYLLNNAIRWKKFGFRVTIICQDRKAATIPAVNSYIQGEFPTDTPKLNKGELRVVVPNINIIPTYKSVNYSELPVTIKPIQEMTDYEIYTNISMTTKCLKAVIEHDPPFKVMANYMLLSGTICERVMSGYGIPYDIILPGAALQYSVKPFPHLFKWVLPTLKKAENLFQLTCFLRTQFCKCFGKIVYYYRLLEKITIINPGINVSHFLVPESFKYCEKLFLRKLKYVNKNYNYNNANKIYTLNINNTINSEYIHSLFTNYYKKYNYKDGYTNSNLEEKWIPYSYDDEIVIYSGAIINNKGMGYLLAIAPKLIAQRPTLKFIFFGSGPFRWHMSWLIKAYENGDLYLAKRIAYAGDFITEVNVENHFMKIDKKISERIIYCSLTSTHYIISHLLPLCTLYLCPSRTLYSCSLNIIEAMLYGLTPICNDHSWHNEVLNCIEAHYPELTAVSRIERSYFFNTLPKTIIKTLDFIKNNKLSKLQYKQKIRSVAVNNYSWDETALRLALPRYYKYHIQS